MGDNVLRKDRKGPSSEKIYDLIVVGGGIAGCEAAWTAAQEGFFTLLCSITLDQLNFPPFLSCIFMREDEVEAQRQRLQETLFLKALEGSLEGCFQVNEGNLILIFDRREFSLTSKSLIENHPKMDFRQALITSIEINEYVEMRSIFGESFWGERAIVAPGAFVRGRVEVGGRRVKAGRYGDLAADELGDVFESRGLKLVEWRGETPPIVDIRRVDTGRWCILPQITHPFTSEGERRGKGWWEEARVFILPREDRQLLLVPVGRKTSEAFLFGTGEGGRLCEEIPREAIIRYPVRQRCMVMENDGQRLEEKAVFTGLFARKIGYIACALDGRQKAMELVEGRSS